ncbi:MAG: CDF family Co(II)/Ni(II) efflux transporter DmeF [Planctomycetes bacterium]|nr:CDF family Co(II)/Ni(II) efflux transporter DmeF [Planctomycetota bacterium]
MHQEDIQPWQHSHAFGQDERRPGEIRTIIVIGITGVMMVVEIATGVAFGSMALLADGLHMASHAAALTINAFAYVYARRHAYDGSYSFGTGKVNSLGGFTGAILLGLFAVMMAWESVERLIHPVDIAVNQAILVAFLGLLVNGASVFILAHGDHGHTHGPEHDGGVGHEHHDHHDHHGHEGDHNLRAAYLHVMADALTSLLAIFALLAAKYFGVIWMDPVMGIVGAILVSRWSLGLLRTTSSVLLDRQGPELVQTQIKDAIERRDDNRIAEIHVWSIGPSIYAAIISVVTQDPKPAQHYKQIIPPTLGIAHISVEVHRYTQPPDLQQAVRRTDDSAVTDIGTTVVGRS